MPRKNVLQLYVALLFSSLLWASSSLAVGETDHTGTVYLSDGSVYENVVYEYKKQYLVLTVFLETGEKPISLHLIARIENPAGEDITRLVTGRDPQPIKTESPEPATPAAPQKTVQQSPTPPPPQSVWTPADSREKVRRRRTTWTTGFGLGLKGTIPVFRYYESFSAGVGFEAYMRIALTRNIALRGIVSRTTHDGSWVDLNIWRFFAAVEYYNSLTREDSPNKTWFYWYAGLGATDNGAGLGYGYSYSETKFTLANGVGFIFMVANSIGIDLGASYDLLFIGTVDNSDGYSYPYNNVQTAGLLDIRVAVSFVIPRN